MFIAIGEAEIEKELKVDDESSSSAVHTEGLIDEMPSASSTSFCEKFKALLISNLFSLLQNSVLYTMIILWVFLVIMFATVYAPIEV